MALNPATKYPTQTNAPDANYPYGSAKNVIVPGDGLGYPWEADVVNDTIGFVQKLLNQAGVTPSGNPETIVASDYYDSLSNIIMVHSMAGATFSTATGTVDAIEAIPVLGATGPIIPKSYAQMEGANITFLPLGANTVTGVTLDIGQTAGTLLGPKKLLNGDGSALGIGQLQGGIYAKAVYSPAADSANGAWLLTGGGLANTDTPGIVERATDAEAQATANTTNYITPAQLALDVGAWQTPTLTNGWAFGPNPLRYRLIEYGRTLEICLSLDASAATAVQAFTLPVAYRHSLANPIDYILSAAEFQLNITASIASTGVVSVSRLDTSGVPSGLVTFNIRQPLSYT